ncbi:MAG: carboxypeptidase regulatory-like domain-containing protein, partial [Candidatus Magnetomorum sp.]|nr:carboxypeptidase regulatory-like domain-containing protein [Candidatus Magnetomorum sp.]
YTATLSDDSALPAWLTFNAATGIFSGTPVNEDVGILSIKVTAIDTSEASVSDVFYLTIINTNDKPILANPIQDYTVNEDEKFTITLGENTFVDSDQGDVLTYTATLDNGSIVEIFNAQTKTFTATPVNENVGSITITVTAYDQSHESAYDVFVITILNTNDPPIILNEMPNQTAKEDKSFSFTFQDDLFYDFDKGDALTYTVSLDDDSPLPSWLAFHAPTRLFSGIPTNDDVGTMQIKITATDQADASAFQVFDLTVLNENDAPALVNKIHDQEAIEDTWFSFTFDENTFIDSDKDDILIYTAACKDGTPLPGWLKLDAITGKFTGRPGNKDVGAIQIHILATDKFFASASDAFMLTVTNANDSPRVVQPIPNQSVLKDNPFLFTVDDNTFADDDMGDSLTYSMTIENYLTPPEWLSFNPSTRTFSGTPRLNDAGSVIVKVTAYDQLMAHADEMFVLSVIDINYTPTLANSIPDQIAHANTPFTFTFNDNTFQDIDSDILSYTATQENGDDLPAWLMFNRFTRTFAGIPSNDNIGTLRIKLVAYDSFFASVHDSFGIDIYEQKILQKRSISGRITGEGNEDLPGYIVEVWKRNVGFLSDAFTDQNGNYAIVDLPQSENLILAVFPPLGANDYQKQMYLDKENMEPADLLSTQASDLTNINFVLKKSSTLGIKGRVHDGSIGIADIQVDAFSVKTYHCLSVFTDDNGDYTITGLKDTDDYVISAWSDAHESDFYYAIPSAEAPGNYIPLSSALTHYNASTIQPTSPHLSHIDLILNTDVYYNGIITGHVYLNDGSPVAGLIVHAWSYPLNEGNYGTTNDQGAYTIYSLYSVTPQDASDKGYIVSVSSNQLSGKTYPYQAYPGACDNDTATKLETNINDIDFYIQTGNSISGIVLNVNGQPVSGVYMTAWSQSQKQRAETTTDQSGSYTFLNMQIANDYLITAFYPNYPVIYYPDAKEEKMAQGIDITKGNATDIDFRLDKGFVIRGTVFIENETQKASSGIWVNIGSESKNIGVDAPTNADGMYEFTGLDPEINTFVISIRHPDYMPAWYNTNDDSNLFNDTSYTMEQKSYVTPELSESAQARHMILKTGLSIRGIVAYNQTPQSDVTVTAISEKTGGFGLASTNGQLDNEYNFEINGLSPGLYELCIESDIFLDQSSTLELTNENINTIYVNLTLQNHQISGQISGLAKGVNIHLNAISASLKFNRIIQIIGDGNPHQAYMINNLKPANDYTVELYHPNQYLIYNKQNRSADADKINVNGHVTDIDFTIIEGFETLSGTVTFPESAQSGEKAYIEAYSDKTSTFGSATVMYDHEKTVPYMISGLNDAKDYVVMIESEMYQIQYFDQQSHPENATLIDTTDTIEDKNVTFILYSGASICGKTYDDGQPASDIILVAYSNKTNAFYGNISQKDGSYCIDGLNLADDYELKAIRNSDSAPFYYNQTATTRDQNQTTKINTIDNKYQSNIDIYLIHLESISGTIRDQNGQPVKSIWVSAWSESQQTGFGYFTQADGTYLIEDLPKGSDYKVSVQPDVSLPYIPKDRSNVASNSQSIDFTLYKGWTLVTNVTDSKNNSIAKATVELKSESSNVNKWQETDNSGQLSMKGLPEALDYILSIFSPNSASYVPYVEMNLEITENLTKSIILNHGYLISGKIVEIDGVTPVPNATVTAFSKERNHVGQGMSGQNGYYEINNLPQAFDYEITASASSYIKAQQMNVASGSAVHFKLTKGGRISGFVKTESGTGLQDVRVVIESQAIQFETVGLTDSKGYYSVEGLNIYDRNGTQLTDYFVQIFSLGYANQTYGPIQANESANFVCVKRAENEIFGTILDESGHVFLLNADTQLIIKAYQSGNTGGFETKVQASADGGFTIEGLDAGKTYQLKFIYIQNDLVVKSQWAGENNSGVDTRDEAKKYQTNREVLFRFVN